MDSEECYQECKYFITIWFVKMQNSINKPISGQIILNAKNFSFQTIKKKNLHKPTDMRGKIKSN